jgi:hypothetical protein
MELRRGRSDSSPGRESGRDKMYIGIGGIIVLLLILWALGVI